MKALLIIYSIWTALVFIVTMLLFLPFIIIPFLIKAKNKKLSYGTLWLWSRSFSILTGISYEVRGRENIPQSRACIFVCNHTSYLDMPAMVRFLPEFKPLGKVELAKIPVLGLIVKSVAVLVDRSDQQSRKESIKILTRILKQGISIIIFPEGTMNRTGKLLNRFYDGAFKLALATQTPILPMVIVNAGNLFPPDSLMLKPGRIQVKFAPLIETSDYKENAIGDLKEKTFKKMEEMLLEAKKTSKEKI